MLDMMSWNDVCKMTDELVHEASVRVEAQIQAVQTTVLLSAKETSELLCSDTPMDTYTTIMGRRS